MPKVPILMPQLGDSIAEATVLRLLAAQGDTVEADQEIFEVETNKATMGVTTMCGGILSDVFIKEGESVVVGACMAMIEATEEEIERSGATPAGDSTQPSLPASPESVPQAAPSPLPGRKTRRRPLRGDGGILSGKRNGPESPAQRARPPVPAGMKGAHYMSPG
ncbi:MAG: biotin/lipoyl-containing protein [Akkermansia sp.]